MIPHIVNDKDFLIPDVSIENLPENRKILTGHIYWSDDYSQLCVYNDGEWIDLNSLDTSTFKEYRFHCYTPIPKSQISKENQITDNGKNIILFKNGEKHILYHLKEYSLIMNQGMFLNHTIKENINI